MRTKMQYMGVAATTLSTVGLGLGAVAGPASASTAPTPLAPVAGASVIHNAGVSASPLTATSTIKIATKSKSGVGAAKTVRMKDPVTGKITTEKVKVATGKAAKDLRRNGVVGYRWIWAGFKWVLKAVVVICIRTACWTYLV